MGQVLTAAAGDYNAIRALLGGIDPIFLSDAMLDGLAYVPPAEAVMITQVNSQVANGVRTVSAILALPQTELDYIFFKSAIIAYVCYLTTPAMGNLVNTSIGLGEQNVDLGGVGDWKSMGEGYKQMAGYYLTLLENWTSPDGVKLIVSGPVKAGLIPDTLSGFRQPK